VKFVSFLQDGHPCVGLLNPEQEEVHQVVLPTGTPGPSSLLAVIQGWDRATDSSVETVGHGLPIAGLELLAPIPRPACNIYCVGKNYVDHAEEFARSGFDATGNKVEAPSHPIFFTKTVGSVVGPGHPVDPHPAVTSALDYEAEIAVIIGRGGRSIAAEDTWKHIWGYTLINDVTARDLQQRHRQWFLGKSLDTFCPMGPWAVTADEVDATDMDLECRVNGELRQQANTKDLIFDIPTLISTLSAGLSLEAGDIIATGTPAGVGIGFEPPRFLQAGDVMSVSASGLGTLTNPILREV